MKYAVSMHRMRHGQFLGRSFYYRTRLMQVKQTNDASGTYVILHEPII